MRKIRIAIGAAALLLTAAVACAEEAGAPLLGERITPEPSQVPELTAVPLEEADEPEEAPFDLGGIDEAITQEQIEQAGLGERILMRGLEGDDVALMQKRLYQLGYYTGSLDGKFGIQTSRAVYAFQRAHGLAKIDGKVGQETLGRMLGEDVIALPTPTPEPTPVPTPSPVPTPAPTAVPDLSKAPFAIEETPMLVADANITLMAGRDDAGELLYPLCGLMECFGYAYTYAAGSWQLTREEDGAQIALMTAGEEGLCEGAMGSVNGVVFLADETNRVYAYGGEAYVTEGVLKLMGLSTIMVGDVPVIE